MSTAHPTSEQEPDDPNDLGEDTTPCPPIVHIGSRAPQIQVFLSLEDANEAAQTGLEEEFYDVCGRVLTSAGDDGGPSHLEAHGEGDPARLRQRLMTELRSGAERAGEDEAAEVDAILCWLEAAPDLEYMLHAMAFGPAGDGNGSVETPASIPCHRCNVFEKLFRRDCCPGG